MTLGTPQPSLPVVLRLPGSLKGQLTCPQAGTDHQDGPDGRDSLRDCRA